MASIPLIKGIRFRFPSCRIVLSTYTPAGRELLQKRNLEADRIIYFPFDVFPITERVISILRPTVFIIVETDLWPNFILNLGRKKIPCLLINGRISSRRVLAFLFYRWVFREMKYFCVQTDLDVKRLLQLKVDRRKIEVTGNMKFAQAVMKDGDPSRFKQEFGIPDGVHLLIAGSTHEGEEKKIIRCYQSLCRQHNDLYLLLAPRHPDRTERVASLIRSQGFSCVRRSCVSATNGNPIYVLDTIGELSCAYALGTIIFVGGSLVRHGGHNVLEAAAWGKPIFFGPHMESYAGIADMLEREGGAVCVKDGMELAAQINKLLGDEERLAEMGRNAASFVARHQGALERNLDIIEKIVGGRSGCDGAALL